MKLADVENATARFPTTEVTEYINQGIAELYDLLVSARGVGFYEKTVTIVTDGINTNYALPLDFYQLVMFQVNLGFSAGVSVTTDTNIALEQFMMHERPELSSSTPGWAGQPFKYRIHGGDPSQPNQVQGTINTGYTVELLPPPSANIKVQMFYVPSCPRLVNDNDVFDGINGWEEYAIFYAAMLMRYKDDLPADHMVAMLDRLKSRIMGLASHRDMTPQRTIDVRTRWHYGSWRRRTRGW
jgi:hypothetical protein